MARIKIEGLGSHPSRVIHQEMEGRGREITAKRIEEKERRAKERRRRADGRERGLNKRERRERQVIINESPYVQGFYARLERVVQIRSRN